MKLVSTDHHDYVESLPKSALELYDRDIAVYIAWKNWQDSPRDFGMILHGMHLISQNSEVREELLFLQDVVRELRDMKDDNK